MTEQEKSAKACKCIRATYHSEASEPISDEEIIKLYPDAWAWYMKGFSDAQEFELYKPDLIAMVKGMPMSFKTMDMVEKTYGKIFSYSDQYGRLDWDTYALEKMSTDKLRHLYGFSKLP